MTKLLVVHAQGMADFVHHVAHIEKAVAPTCLSKHKQLAQSLLVSACTFVYFGGWVEKAARGVMLCKTRDVQMFNSGDRGLA